MRKNVQICYFNILLLLLSLPASESLDKEESEKCALKNMTVVCDDVGGTLNPYCTHNMSHHCFRNHGLWQNKVPKKCYNTLSQEEETSVCEIELVRQTNPRCGSIRPQYSTPLNEPLVQLRLYHFSSFIWESEALVNLTFPNPTWQELEFQSSVMSSGMKPQCLNYTLHQPINSTLMFDCRFRTKNINKTRSIKLTVQTESGHGATYIYQLPLGRHINPQKTCPTEWHTFFYIHKDAIQRFQPLPVTVQSAPFDMVDYKVSLGRCPVAEDEECSKFVEVDHVIVTKNTSDDLWTVELSPARKGGDYTVRVQIVSDWCHMSSSAEGCHIAMSPKFIIPSDITWVVLVMSVMFIILFIICVLIMIFTQRRVNKKFFRELATKQTTTLLAYHPESKAVLNFVHKLAEFLHNSCGITPLMMDNGVFLENPTTWMKTHMNSANRVLFIIPMKAEALSCTPFTSQWVTAMSECSGSDFIANPERVKCLAKLVHPKSGVVPCEIRNIQRFDLSDSPAALANWLHGGSYLDQFFIWLPYFRSAVCKNATPSWAHVRLAAQKIGLPSIETEERERSCPSSPSLNVNMDGKGGGGNDDDDDDKVFVDDDDDDDDDKVFDPDIPNVNDKLCDPHQMSDPPPVDWDDEDFELFVAEGAG